METGAKPSRFSREPSPKVVTALLIASGLAILALALPLLVEGWNWRSRTQPVDGGVTTTGRVIEVDEDEGARGGSTYEAVVEFVDTTGARFAITNKAGEKEPLVGDEVTVSYDPDDPAYGHDLTTGQGVWRWPFWTGVLMAFTATFPLCAGILRILTKKPAPD